MTHFSRKSLSVAITALLGVGLLSTSVHAVGLIISDDATASSTPLKYAAEIARDDATLGLKNTGNIFDLQVDLGQGFDTGQGYFPRFDFTNATLASPKPLASVTAPDAAANPSSPAAVGDSYFFFSLTAGAARGATDDLKVVFDPALPALKLAQGAPNVIVSYAMYGTSTGASNSDPAQRFPASVKSLEILNFSTSAVSFSADISATEPKIDVGQSSKKFDNGKNLVMLGKLTHKETADVYLADGSLAATATPDAIDFAATGSSLIVKGDFAASVPTLANVFLSMNSDCSTTDKAAKTLSATEASWAIDNLTLGKFIGGASGSDVYVCMNTNGATEISGGLYSAIYKPIAVSGYKVDPNGIKVDLETLQRNGVVLVSPMVNVAPSVADYATRIMLTNESGKEAPMTMSVLKDKDGTLALVAGKETAIIPAQGALLLKLEEITTGNRGAIIFQINGPSGLIHGVYRIRAVGSDSFDSYPLLERTTQ